MTYMTYIGAFILLSGIVGMVYTGVTTNASVSLEKGLTAIFWMMVTGIGGIILIIRFLIWLFSR